MRWFCAALVFALGTGQVRLDRIVRSGDPGPSLPEIDVAAIEQLAHEHCGKLWLIQTLHTQSSNEPLVYAYCVPSSETGPLRRGTVLIVQRRDREPWNVARTSEYAQVAAGTRAPNRPPGSERDLERPFRLEVTFSPADVLDLVSYIRSGPPNPQPSKGDRRVERDWPISRIWKGADGLLVVSLARDDMSAQRVTLRKSANGWEVVSVQFVIA